MRSTNEINWSELRAAAIMVGVREAARRASANLTPQEQTRFVNRCLKRSEREGWVTKAESDKAQPLTIAKPLSSTVINGSEVIKSQLEEDSTQTKISLSRGIRKAAKSVETMEGRMIYASADKAKNLVGAASMLHNWEKEEKGSGVMPPLSIYSNQTVISIGSKE